jgi:adenosine deaminase CECR1
MVGSQSMNIHGWRQLAEWSIEYSCLSVAEKAQAMDIFKKEWEDFCQWIIKEHGGYAAGLDIKVS